MKTVSIAAALALSAALTPALAQGHRLHSGGGHVHSHEPSEPKQKTTKPRKRSAPASHSHAHAMPSGHRHRPAARTGHAGHSHGLGGNGHDHHGIETEHLFGFTIGTDVGHSGEKEAVLDITGRFGKRDGSYSAPSKRSRSVSRRWRTSISRSALPPPPIGFTG